MPFRSAAVAAFLSLAACGGGGSPGITVTVSPATTAVAVGETAQFTASVAGSTDASVTWSVAEGTAGGTVSTTGLYTAPPLPGSFHVVATSVADGSRKGTAAVSVLAAPACTPPVPQPTALPAAQVLQLGVHTVGKTVTFTVPGSTGSVTILQQGAEPLAAQTVNYQGTPIDNNVVPLTVKVGATTFYDDNVIPPDDPANWNGTNGPNGIGAIYFGTLAPWTGTMTVPNTTNMLEYVTDHGGVPAGTWSVVVNDYAEECRVIGRPDCVIGDGVSKYPPGRYDVKVLLKPGAVPATGTLDVRFYLVADTLTAATAPADPSVVRMSQTLGTLLAGAGLALGNVSFADVSPTVKARFAAGVNADEYGPCSEIATILQLAGAGNVMNLFLVSQFNSTQPGTGIIVGIDGTIPGPATAGGTVASGALVSVQDLSGGGTSACQGAVSLAGCPADRTAYIAAHETGHFLGLYHDTESFGTLFDPIRDTRTCLCSACAPAAEKVNCYTGGAVTSTTYDMTTIDCTRYPTDPTSVCGGGENLMFWLLGSRSTGAVTPQQSSIIRATALVR